MLGGSGVGFFSSGAGGGSKVQVVDIKQYVVQAGQQAQQPINGETFFAPPLNSLQGNNCVVSVSGFGFLNGTTVGTQQVSFVSSGGYITQINLLGGLTFQTGEVYTVIAYNGV